MHDSKKSTGRAPRTGTAVLLGSVLGLILGGTLVTGICGWQLWAANAAEAAASTGDAADTRLPTPTYAPGASPYATPYDTGSNGYGTSSGQPTYGSSGSYGSAPAYSDSSQASQPANTDPEASGPSTSFYAPSNVPEPAKPTSPDAPAVSESNKEDNGS
ncbi:MAG: hypothetical protein H8E44_44030 [Planctomycetes bacterium]|nr:hypothetical protein [Planctomycetota bacterium]MBL7041614.1 hypothetical protein [Pirellulaceae bacterium]